MSHPRPGGGAVSPDRGRARGGASALGADLPLSIEASARASFDALLAHCLPDILGLAVSGGGDSTALMVLAASWAQDRDVTLMAASVDHRLRDGAADEIALAAELAASLGIHHETLVWRDAPGTGNLQAAARAARYGLLADWAARHGIAHLCLGHTRDDQAETVLLRLARGSGVDGLSGMASVRHDHGIAWLRPLLGLRRSALQEMLVSHGVRWAEDPSNDDARFDRVRARRMLTTLAPLGLDVETLVQTADRMRAARRVLCQQAAEAARACVSVRAGAVVLEAERWSTLADETRLRVLSAAVMQVGGHQYRPRLATLRRAEADVRAGHGVTLCGCQLLPGPQIWIAREPAALRSVEASPGMAWDNCWQVDGPPDRGHVVAMTGEAGLAALSDWRSSGLPRVVAMTTPAVWRDGAFCGAPALQPAAPWFARQIWNKDTFILGLTDD